MASEIVLTPKQIAQVTRLREIDEYWASKARQEAAETAAAVRVLERQYAAGFACIPVGEHAPARVTIWTKVTKHNLRPEVVSLVERYAAPLLAADRKYFEMEYRELATRLGKTIVTACGKSLSQFYPPPSDAGAPLGGSENFTAINDLLRPLSEALYYMNKYEESPAAAKAREDKKRRDMVSATPKRTQVEILKDMACRKRDALVTKHGLTPSEAEAVLAHFGKGSFPKDTLTALRVINGFAAKNGIRFEDAETVLRE